MADHADDDGDDIFVYRGGRAPLHVTHVRIDGCIDVIEEYAFYDCFKHLMQVVTHDGIRKVGKRAFFRCIPFRRLNLKSAEEVDEFAFYLCANLESVEFGDKLETIRGAAFNGCTSLERLKLPSVIAIQVGAFMNCRRVTDVEFSERLETMGGHAFHACKSLQRIAIPLKRNLFGHDNSHQEYTQFHNCEQLTTVDLVGGIHKAVASLHMESWRNEMIAEINRINQVLPNTPVNGKTKEILKWMESVINQMDHYKAEHYKYVKEGMTLLELALWKAKLGEKEDNVDSESTRMERRIKCGADIVIRDVLPFLQLE